MNTERAPETAIDAVPTPAANSRTMIGHVIVCQAQDDHDDDAIAIWHVDTNATNTGAWIVPVSLARTDPAVARTLLQHCLQRAVVAWDPTKTLALLSALERAAHVFPADWATYAIALPDLLTEIADIRSEFERRIINERQARKNIAPLEWDIEMPNPIPQDAEELQKAARLIKPSACPAAQEALLLSGLVRWCTQRWHETLTILKRRDYLRSSVEQLGVLPPCWENHVASAYAQLRSLRDNRDLIHHSLG